VALLGGWIANTYALLVAAVVIAGALALLSGALFVRASGAYFLMLTLAFAQVLFAVAFQARSITGGGDGMSVPVTPNLGFGEVVGGYSLYYMMAIIFLICYLLLRLFVASPAGRAVIGVMENESRMRALGYNTRFYKVFVYSLSGAMAGLAGALYAYFNFYVTPDLFGWVFSGQALIMVIVGGVGSLLGPALGAGFFILLQEYVSAYTERWPLVMGLIFMAFVLIGRGGMYDLLVLAFRRLVPQRIRREVEPPPPEPAPTRREKVQ
jgi:branched-chain amino acid transport system permease protein